ncbi:hypothetical protein BH10BAC2_BH10BAC2_14350 [soil metagenome]
MRKSIQTIAVIILLMGCLQTVAQQPIPKLTDRSKKGLLAYFQTIVKNNQVIVGQQCSETPDAGLEYKTQFNRLYDSCGKYPALIGLEYGYFVNVDLPKANEVAIDHWKKRGLVTISWHADNPFTDGYDVRWNPINHKDSIDVKMLLKAAPASKEKSNYRNELNKVADALKQLKQAGVMLLWRPFHEMNGAWFWWGPNDSKAPTNIEDYQALWKDMYETFTKEFGLDNLIWVYSPFTPEGNVMPSVTAFYPGDKYVDIVAVDVYPKAPQFNDYNDLKKLGKPVTNGEIGPANESFGIFDELELLKTLKGKAPYFLQWSSWTGAKVNIVDNLNYKEMMNDSAAITLDKIK